MITDVSAWQGYSATASLTVEEATSGITIVQLEPPSSAVWYSHWTGRQVIPNGMGIKVVCNNTAGNIRICGYQLQMNIPT